MLNNKNSVSLYPYLLNEALTKPLHKDTVIAPTPKREETTAPSCMRKLVRFGVTRTGTFAPLQYFLQRYE